MSCYLINVEATRKRLEALLGQLERATAIADNTIAEVKAALQEMDKARATPGGRPVRRGRSTKRRASGRSTPRP
jgi:hypothetical protein